MISLELVPIDKLRSLAKGERRRLFKRPARHLAPVIKVSAGLLGLLFYNLLEKRAQSRHRHALKLSPVGRFLFPYDARPALPPSIPFLPIPFLPPLLDGR